MLISLIPLFDAQMSVKAYSVFSQKNNQFLNPLSMGTASNDGASAIPGIEVIKTMGLETIADECEVFVPVSNVAVFSDIAGQLEGVDKNRIVLLLDHNCIPIPMYVNRIKELREQGFRMGIRSIPVLELNVYSPILAHMDYVLLNNKKIDISKGRIFFEKLFPHIKLVAGNIETQEIYDKLKKTGGYQFYEGEFYRVPLTVGAHDVAPVKMTYLQLLKVVNSPDFELNAAADVIGRDPALTVSLLKMVNRVVKTAEITTIRHAAAMLGQKELKRWINTAVTEELYADKPGEVTRLALLRARFAENLGDAFELSMQKEQLFLMGLFSVLDVILEKPIAEALDMIQVSGEIKDALVNHKGNIAPVLDFMLQYETANWTEVSRQMLMNNIEIDMVQGSYMESLAWYRQTIVG